MLRFDLNDTIRIIGLQFNVRHGAWPEEKTLPQPFEVDVEIERDLSLAAESDRLKDTIDYSRVVDLVSEVMNGPRTHLLEHLAGKIIARIGEEFGAGTIAVRLRKPRAPIVVPFQTVEIEMKRTIQ